MDNDKEILYQAFQMANEKRKRDNFDTFMTTLGEAFITDLDKVYASGDMTKYEQLLSNIKKNFGFRIFRNGEGKHKIKFI